MAYNHTTHIPIYKGNEDPKIHWFIYEKMSVVANIIDEGKIMAQFASSLR